MGRKESVGREEMDRGTEGRREWPVEGKGRGKHAEQRGGCERVLPTGPTLSPGPATQARVSRVRTAPPPLSHAATVTFGELLTL